MFCACWKDGTRWAFSGLWELLLLAGGVVLVARSSTTNRCGDALPCQSRAAFRPLNSCSLPTHQPPSLLLFSLLVQVFAQKRIHVKDIDLGVRNSSSHVSFVASCRLKTPPFWISSFWRLLSVHLLCLPELFINANWFLIFVFSCYFCAMVYRSGSSSSLLSTPYQASSPKPGNLFSFIYPSYFRLWIFLWGIIGMLFT